MLYKGIVSTDGFVQLLEPKILNGRTYFKIKDEGNLHYFPPGSRVNFSLVKQTGRLKDDEKAIKLASIHSKDESEEIIENNVIEFVKPQKPLEPVELKHTAEGMHFYVVFNPMFNTKVLEEIEGMTQAHSFYNLLLTKVRDSKNNFLYWGKLKSTDVLEPLNKQSFTDIVKKNNAAKKVTHLYISDFHFFWVARVEAVEFDLDKATHAKHTLNFYIENWDRIEAWFKISDMKLLSNNPKETNDFIRQLVISPTNKLNSRQDPQNKLSVTPYLSGLRYPLIIEDEREEVYFDFTGKEKAITQKNVLMANSEGETQRLKSIVYSYVIPERVFNRFSHQVQNEILSAEIELINCKNRTKEDIYRTNRSVARKYLIALEKCLNDIIRHTNPPSSSLLFSPGDNLGLGDILNRVIKKEHDYLLKLNRPLYELLSEQTVNLSIWADIRNKKVHLDETIIDLETLKNVRRVILGVGTKGILIRLYQATFPDLKDLHKMKKLATPKAA
jgi:hypothetical protein